MHPSDSKLRLATLPLAILASLASMARAAEPADQQVAPVVVTGQRATQLPVSAPAVIEIIDKKQIEEKVNITDSSDVLKYMPSLQVRKRYIGDFDHAIVSTRTSGSGTSARTLTFADGMLLSNLLGNSNNYTPRWGMVSPEEIDSVDFLYGPFSAAYSGSSIGGVLTFNTRMPAKLEAHATTQAFQQDFNLYSTHKQYSGKQVDASVGSRAGAFSFWLGANHQDNTSQPIAFVTKNLSTTPASGADRVATGANADRSTTSVDRLVLGTTSEIHTKQDNAKLKFAYDFTPALRATYTYSNWHNDAERNADSYLRDGAGNQVWSGNVNIGGQHYTIAPTDFSVSTQEQEHEMHGISLVSNSGGKWDWSTDFSSYDYSKDIQRTSIGLTSAGTPGGAGRITDMQGTGWHTFDAKGIWRPTGKQGTHEVSFGYHADHYQLRTVVWDTPEWTAGAPTTRFLAFDGTTETKALWAQEAWRFAPDWKATVGLRAERWHAYNGSLASTGPVQYLPERQEHFYSPKASLSWQAWQDWALRASIGRAYRVPTVAELYQGSVTGTTIVNNDPNLRPENALSKELTAEGELWNGTLRTTYFHESVKDALYSQTNINVVPNVTNIQNIDLIVTQGVEVAWQGDNVIVRGLDLGGSVTYADSRIKKNDKNPASVGKHQIRVPDWKATLSTTWHQDEKLSYSLGMRYSGRQYGNIDNSDNYEETYFGVTRLFMADVKLLYKIGDHLKASFGIDNLNNNNAWSFHPYSQRTYFVSLKADL